MQTLLDRTNLFNGAWFLAWALASSVWCLTASQELSATFDEPLYLVRGLEGWRAGSHRGLLKLGTMPLAIDLQTLPLYIYERWTGNRLDPAVDLDRLLPWTRAVTLTFWWLLLFFGWRAGRLLAGDWGGRLSVAFLACEPSLLAHASLATTDIAVSACLLALAYSFYTGRDRGWWRRIAWPSFWFAAAILSKASGLVFGPLCLIAVEIERLVQERRMGKVRSKMSFDQTLISSSLPHSKGERLAGVSAETNDAPTSAKPLMSPRSLWSSWLLPFHSLWRDLWQIVPLGLLLVFLYCGSDWQPEPSFVAWAHKLPEGRLRENVSWFAEHLRIFSNAAEGMVRQIRHNVRGHGMFLLGQIHPRAVWYYFPMVLLIKLTLSMLLLPVILLFVRPRSLLNWAYFAAAALLLFSVTCRVQIGIRLILPLVVLALVGLAGAAVRACQAVGRRSDSSPAPEDVLSSIHAAESWSIKRYLLTGAAGLSLLWSGASAAMVWPQGLCYTNELWGGTQGGYLCLSDSNYDWGQGLKELASWKERNGVHSLDIWYFGGADPRVSCGSLRPLPLHVPPIASADDVIALVRGHYLAASTTLLYGAACSCDTISHRQSAELLKHRQPIARTTTYLIYDFTHEPEPRSQSREGEQPRR